MKKRRWLAAALAPALLCLAAGCQTTVPVTYTEPARLDLSGVNRVAIDSNNAEVEASISQKIGATGKYTVASAAELSEWKQWKTDRQAVEALAAYQALALEINAADLVNAYSDNTVRADSQYLGKAIRISAVVLEIGSARGRYFVRLEGADNDSVDVFFAPSELDRIAEVNRGDTITVIGECTGYKPPDMEDTAEILRILGAGRSVNVIDATFPIDGLPDYPGAVDAVIFLTTTSSVQDGTHVIKRNMVDRNGRILTDAQGRSLQENVTIHDRTVVVDIDYQVERARNGSRIGGGTKSDESTSSNEDYSKLADSASMVARTINGPLSALVSEIVPTQRSLSLTLAKESENKEAKKEMRAAEKLAKEQNYAEAAAAYGAIYAVHDNFAAGYNHAVLTEVAAGTETALELMEALSQSSGHPLALETLRGMRERNAANQMSAAQLSQ
jgi:hypothetical protein